MRVKYITEIAFALIIARWKQTGVAAVGVTFSITLFIALLGFMEGLNTLLDSLILNRTPHIRLYNDLKISDNQPISMSSKYKDNYNFINSVKPYNTRKEIYNVAKIINQLENDKRVFGIAPKIPTQVFYNVGNIELNGVINGIDVEKEAKLFFFNDYVIEGDYKDLKKIANSIILGKGAADKMLAKVGDIINITTSNGEQFSLKVVGFFQSGMAELDKVQSYASLATTQKLLGKPENYISDIQIKIYEIEKAPMIAIEYSKLFGVDAEDIQTANSQFETGSSVRSLISYAVGLTLLIVSGFGISNILNMLIYEKMDTIAILKATGFDSSDIKKIFTTISLTIGICGGLAGLLFGFLLSLLIDSIPFVTASLPTVETYPIDYGIRYYITAITFALFTTYFAGWFPARKASKLDPVIIIRVR